MKIVRMDAIDLEFKALIQCMEEILSWWGSKWCSAGRKIEDCRVIADPLAIAYDVWLMNERDVFTDLTAFCLVEGAD